MIEAGRAYVSANKLFVNGIKDLSQQCKKEEAISVSRSNTVLHLSQKHTNATELRVTSSTK